MNQKQTERLKEIIALATKLNWTYPQKQGTITFPGRTLSYPLMQLSEVEKCMVAMVDDLELDRMRQWVNEETQALIHTKPK